MSSASPPAEIRVGPQPGPQTAFLSSPADIVVYGGSAGGGKSWGLLADALRHVHNPQFGAVYFRRTSPQITNEGGLWDEAGKLYPQLDAVALEGALEWRFPSGANLSFRHLQHEATKYNWQGSQVCGLYFDELTHYTESQFFYMFSRNRSQCGVRPYIRASTNPDAGSWVKKLLAPWVDRKFAGVPARSGEVRWFARVEGKIAWVGADFPNAKSITFIRAQLSDNKILMAQDPGYLANLMALADVERERLLNGNWDAVAEGLVYPTLGECVVEREDWPAGLPPWNVGGIDWGWHNPFGALAAYLDRDDVLWVGWERHLRETTLGEHSAALAALGESGEAAPRGEITWWADPAGADQVGEMRRADHDVRPSTHLGKDPLKTGIAAVTQRIRTGRLKVGGWLGNLIDEAAKYRYDKQTEKPLDKDNHLLGALRYLVTAIDRGKAAAPPEPEDPELAEERARALIAEQEAAEWERRQDPTDPSNWPDDEDDC